MQRQTDLSHHRPRAACKPAPPTVEYRVGTAGAGRARGSYAVPQDVAVEVPAVRTYKYMRVNNRVVLVDPATSEVVAEFAD